MVTPLPPISEAVAEIVVVPETMVLLIGDVTETVGAVESFIKFRFTIFVFPTASVCLLRKHGALVCLLSLPCRLITSD